MSGSILSPLVAGITWPAHRFATRRTHELSISPVDLSAILRGAVADDPLFRRVGDGFAQSAQLEVVARVWDRRFEMYMSGKYASGIGLISTVEATANGSRVITSVGWTGPTKWVMPAVTVLALAAGAVMAADIPDALSSGGSDAWATIGVFALCVGGQLGNLISRERRARHDDLPMLFKRLDDLLAPFTRSV